MYRPAHPSRAEKRKGRATTMAHPRTQRRRAAGLVVLVAVAVGGGGDGVGAAVVVVVIGVIVVVVVLEVVEVVVGLTHARSAGAQRDDSLKSRRCEPLPLESPPGL